MFSDLEHYKQGHFFFSRGNDLQALTKSIPDLPGVYYILRLSHGKVDIVYIGKSEPIPQNGDYKKSSLRRSIINGLEGVKMEDFFNQKIDDEQIDALDIYWFVTMDRIHQDLPGYIQGVLMQHHFNVHGNLPEWNKGY